MSYFHWLGAEAEDAHKQKVFWDKVRAFQAMCTQHGETIVHADGSVTENRWGFAEHYGHDD